MYFQGNFNAQFPQSIFFFPCRTYSKEILKRGCLHNFGNRRPQRFHLPRNAKEWFTFWWWKEQYFRYVCFPEEILLPWDVGRGWFGDWWESLRYRTQPGGAFILQHDSHPAIKMFPHWPAGSIHAFIHQCAKYMFFCSLWGSLGHLVSFQPHRLGLLKQCSLPGSGHTCLLYSQRLTHTPLHMQCHPSPAYFWGSTSNPISSPPQTSSYPVPSWETPAQPARPDFSLFWAS